MFQINIEINGMRKSSQKVSSIKTNVKYSVQQYITASNVKNANADQCY